LRALFIAALSVAPLLAAAPDVDLQGSARVAAKAESNVVVWIDVPPPLRSAVRRPPVLDQRNLQFFPRVLAVQVGTSVDFPNNDRVFHNVFSFRDGKRFDLGLYPIGSLKHVLFDKPGISRLFCNIHPQMAAYVVAVDSPAFAVSDANGGFTLWGIPEGTYTYHAWRAGASQLTGSVSIRAGSHLEIQWP
jgi:plastocyanin